MAFWFVLITISYLFINLITWDMNTVTASMLALMGISATTAISASLITANRPATIRATMSAHNEEVTKLRALEANTQDAGVKASLNTQISELQEEITQLSNHSNPTSHGFLNDLLYDGEHLSLHRFQIAVWTLILGGLFTFSVMYNLSMPEFGTELLALMGISSGTYLGFKFAGNDTK
jgi:hypothetical protein